MFHSTEFYVICLMAAAAIVALMSRRESASPVRQYLLAGVLSQTDSYQPEIDFFCCEDGSVVLRRRGLRGVTLSSAVSLAVEVKGFDITIYERHAPARSESEQVDTASFILDFLANERYFIRYVTPLTPYESEKIATLTLHNRPDMTVTCALI
ncbi:MAG: hypothetical protein K2K55_00130 [Duncaniella sp.]|nr:hypothetical protein [Duncaniella sp.]